MAEPDLAQGQQRHIRGASLGVLIQKPLQHPGRRGDLVLGQGKLRDFPERFTLPLRRHPFAEILLVSGHGFLRAAQAFKQAGLKRRAVRNQVDLRRRCCQRHQVRCALQRFGRPPLRQLNAAKQVLPAPGGVRSQLQPGQRRQRFSRCPIVLPRQLRFAQQQVTVRHQLIRCRSSRRLLKNPLRSLQHLNHSAPVRQLCARGRFADSRLQTAPGTWELPGQFRKRIRRLPVISFAQVRFRQPEKVLIGIGAAEALVSRKQLDRSRIIRLLHPRLGLIQNRLRPAC